MPKVSRRFVSEMSSMGFVKARYSSRCGRRQRSFVESENGDC